MGEAKREPIASQASADAVSELPRTSNRRTTPDEALAEAIDLIRADPEESERFFVQILRWLSQELVRAGMPEDRAFAATHKLGPLVNIIHAQLIKSKSWKARSVALHSLASRLVLPIVKEYRRDPSQFPTVMELFRAKGGGNVVESSAQSDVEYGNLSESIVAQLEERLREEGMSEADRAKFIQSTMANFQGAAVLSNPEQAKAAVDLTMAAVRATRGAAASFGQAAKPALPPRAPEIWMERDRSKGETPVAFLNRVWGPWMEAGVLYQDDIKRLGDPKLVQTIRVYCDRKGLKAAEVLPPPRQARLDRALAEAAPGSPAEVLIKRKMRDREAMARRHKSQRPK